MKRDVLDFSKLTLADLMVCRMGQVYKVTPGLDEFKHQYRRQTAFQVAGIHLRAAGVDLSTPEGRGLLRAQALQQMNSDETQGEKQRLAGAKCRARVKAAKQLSALRVQLRP